MRIAVFYRDIFQSGGVPNEVRGIVNALAEYHEVHLWGRDGHVSDDWASNVKFNQYNHLAALGPAFSRWVQNIKPDLLLLVGFFFHENLVVAKIARKHEVLVVLNPVAQVTDQVLAGKIFNQDPDVRKLEQVGLQLPSLRSRLTGCANPILKRTYLNSLGRLLVGHCDRIAVFSSFEARQFQKHLPFPLEHITTLQWGIDQPPEVLEKTHYYRDVLGYRDNRANYVYWGRLDWHYKGIDRLLNGVLECGQTHQGSPLPFRLFLIGPDYRGGAEKITQFVQTHGLQDSVHLMLPGSYPAGSKAPLRDASASLYLSRWDGFPRTLRESTMLHVPVLVSAETHFGELVTEYRSGLMVSNPDDPEQVAQGLIDLAETDNRMAHQDGARQLSPQLTWHEVTSQWLSGCQPYNAPEAHTAIAL